MVNMLVLSLVVLTAACCDAKATTTDHVFDDEARVAIRDAVKECNEKFGPIPDLCRMVHDGEYMDDENYQKVVHCSYNSTGYTTEDGHIIVEKVASLFPEEAHDTITECSKETGKDEVETTYKFYECFQKNSPVNIGLSEDDC